MKVYEGEKKVFGAKVGIVASKFNTKLSEALFQGVVNELHASGIEDADIIAVRVPGAMEIPGTIVKMLRNNELDLVIALGVVIEGETVHFDHVSEQAIRGIQDISLSLEIPIVNGVLAGTLDQMKERITGKRAKARSFVETGLEMTSLYRKL